MIIGNKLNCNPWVNESGLHHTNTSDTVYNVCCGHCTVPVSAVSEARINSRLNGIFSAVIVTTRNRCKDILKSYWRKSVDLVEEGMDETADSVSTDPPGSDFRAEALDIIMNLPEDQREIILLHYYEGYTVNETADMLKLSESKVRSQIASVKRALSKLTRR